MTEDRRTIDLSVEVPGTPEEVWQAIATGPGITSWYVPHTVEEREGGAATASFGEGPEMQIAGRVGAWEPPHRIVFDKGEEGPGLAFEWTVEAREGGTCIVRLVNSGFGDGEPWDDQYDAMAEGWLVFLLNLRLHLTHYRGEHATPMLPTGMWPGSRDEAWAGVTAALGIAAQHEVGTRVTTSAAAAPVLSGTVVESGPGRLVLLTDQPARGTAFVLAEDYGPASGVSVWAYLYGPEGAEAVARDQPAWTRWLADHAPTPVQ